MSARALLIGAVLGALAAVGVWSLGPTPVSSTSTEPERVVAASDGDTDSSREEPQPEPEAPRMAREPALDPKAALASGLIVLAFGRVTDPEGAPVAGVEPRFSDDQGTTLRASSGPAGTWSLRGLAPGEVELTIEAAGFLPFNERVVVPASEHWRHDVQLDLGRTLPVRFETPTGEAIETSGFNDIRAYLGAFATRAKPSSPLSGVRGRVLYRHGLGIFRSRAERNAPAELDARYQGVLEIQSVPPLWVGVACRDVVLESRPLGLDEQELVFVIDEEQLEGARGEVRVRIVERETGVPIEKGLELSHPSGGIHASSTYESGTHVFSRVPAGSMDLMSSSREWERLERRVHVPAGGSVDLGTIELGRRETFEVHVEDEAGEPLAISIEAARTALVVDPSDLDLRIDVRSNVEGVAEVRHLAPGETLLRAGGRDGWARTAELVDTRSSRTLKLVLARGTEVAFLRRGKRPAGAEYVLEDDRQRVLYAGSYLPGETFLRPGDYELRVLVDGLQVERIPMRVAAERVVVRYGGS